jgi:hypothetical protein
MIEAIEIVLLVIPLNTELCATVVPRLQLEEAARIAARRCWLEVATHALWTIGKQLLEVGEPRILEQRKLLGGRGIWMSLFDYCQITSNPEQERIPLPVC